MGGCLSSEGGDKGKELKVDGIQDIAAAHGQQKSGNSGTNIDRPSTQLGRVSMSSDKAAVNKDIARVSMQRQISGNPDATKPSNGQAKQRSAQQQEASVWD